jgi:hypothetical protein
MKSTCSGRSKAGAGCTRQGLSSASGKFYAMMQQNVRPSEGAGQTTSGLLVHYLGTGRAAGRIKQADGRLGRVLWYLTSLRRPRTLVGSSLEAMDIISRRRMNATLIGAYIASYLPELN